MIDAICKEVAPIQESIESYSSDLGSVRRIVAEGSEKARDEAQRTLSDVRDAMGLEY